MDLSPRERAVIAGAAEGITVRQIAKSLGIAEGTVRTHRQMALAKLQAPNISAAVASCLRDGRFA